MSHKAFKPKLSIQTNIVADSDEVLLPKPVKVMTSPLKSKMPSFTLGSKPIETPSTPQRPQPATSPSPQQQASPKMSSFATIVSPSSYSLELAGLEIQNILTRTLDLGAAASSRAQAFDMQEEDDDYEAPMFEVDEDEVLAVLTEEDINDLRNPSGKRNVNLFGYDCDDEDYNFGRQSKFQPGSYDLQCITPPVRSDNPLCFDSRFGNSSDYGMSPTSEFDTAEIGLFKFSPPLCSSH